MELVEWGWRVELRDRRCFCINQLTIEPMNSVKVNDGPAKYNSHAGRHTNSEANSINIDRKVLGGEKQLNRWFELTVQPCRAGETTSSQNRLPVSFESTLCLSSEASFLKKNTII